MTRESGQPHPRPALDPSLLARLRQVARRLRSCVLVEGMAWLIGFLVIAATCQFLIDYLTRGVRWSMRAAMLAAIIAGALWVLWRRLIVPLRIPITPADVALLIERRFRDLSSLLITAVRFAGGEVGAASTNSPTLVSAVVDEAGSRAASLDFRNIVDGQRARRAGSVGVGALAVIAAAVLFMPHTLSLWFERNVLLRDVEWPRRTRLVVDLPGDELIAARGDDVVIEATAEGVQPRAVEFLYQTVAGQRGRETMATIGSPGAYRYRYTFKNAQEDFTFQLQGGDDRTDLYRARLLERPRIESTQMRIVPPAYTRLDPVVLGDGQRATQVLPGSTVTLSMQTNKPVVSATLIAGNEPLIAAVPEVQPRSSAVETSSGTAESGARRFSAAFTPDQTRTYHFALVDAFGLEDTRPLRIAIRVVPDEAPRVRQRLPGVGDLITPEAVLPIEVEFADTYGLAAAETVYEITREGGASGAVNHKGFKPGSTSFATSLTWPVSAAGVVPGETLALYARASDFDDVSGPNQAQSPSVSIRVVTRDELLAELSRREHEYRMDFERLVDAQERLRGDLLSVLGRISPDLGEAELATLLAPLERRQRNIAGSVNVVRQQFEQILSELRINQLAARETEIRLGESIVEPLTSLARRDLVAAADTLRRWSRDASPETASTVDPQQVAILSQMRKVLASMIQWEGYQEVVNMLRDILRLQAELEGEVQRSLEDQARDIFDD